MNLAVGINRSRDFRTQLLSLHRFCFAFKFSHNPFVSMQGAEQDKVRFMMLERGPIAFFQGLKKIVHSFFLESSLTSGLVTAAYTRINERVTMLNTLRKRLAIIIGQVSSMIFIFCVAAMWSMQGREKLSRSVGVPGWSSLSLKDFAGFQVHLQVAKMGEKVNAGRESGVRGESRRVVSECVVAVLSALSGMEGVYEFPQAGDDPLLMCDKFYPYTS